MESPEIVGERGIIEQRDSWALSSSLRRVEIAERWAKWRRVTAGAILGSEDSIVGSGGCTIRAFVVEKEIQQFLRVGRFDNVPIHAGGPGSFHLIFRT